MLQEFRKIRVVKKICVDNGQSVDVLGIDTCNLDLRCRKVLHLTKVLYAPDFIYNLIIIHKLTKCKLEGHFKDTNVYVIDDIE